jgi:hypothetical protein
MFIFIYSVNQIEKASLPVWKHNVVYDNLWYTDDIADEYKEYMELSAKVVNSTFPYIKETRSSGDVSVIVIDSKDFLTLETLNQSDEISRYYIYSESFGLYDVPSRLNESISGIPMSDLLLADYVEVYGYTFIVTYRAELYHIFHILDLEAVFSEGATSNKVDVFIEEANYTVSGQEAVDKVLNFSGYELGYRIRAVTSSSGEMENGTVINEMVWLVGIYVTPPERLGGTILHGIVDVHTGKVYEVSFIAWISTPAG